MFERHPDLKLVVAESDAGWLPHYMYRMDHAARMNAEGGIIKGLSKLPSEYIRANVYATFQDDETAYHAVDHFPYEHLLWASDFPHTDSTWPRSRQLIAEQAAAPRRGAAPGDLPGQHGPPVQPPGRRAVVADGDAPPSPELAARAGERQRRPQAPAPRDELDEISALARPLTDPSDLDPLVERIGDARYVLLGEASHGTSEYYRWRAELLLAARSPRRGFSFVAVEGDWPDCFAVNRWVKGHADQQSSAGEVLGRFQRWPTWMWANEVVAGFVGWLGEHNATAPRSRVSRPRRALPVGVGGARLHVSR